MLLEMKHISKEFPGVKALDDITLDLHAGEVLALIGENGAGKSTLIKILSGAYSPDFGQIFINGKEQKNLNPTTAIKHGISVIYQELNSISLLTVAENIFLGNLPEKSAFRVIDYKALREKSTKLLNEVGLNIDPFTPMEKLSMAQKQLVEIAKALTKDIKILVMDEPTAALNTNEITIMFNLIRMLTAKNIGIIYISHRMSEIFDLSDRVLVMRDGTKVDCLKTSDSTTQQLISLMVGREIINMYPHREHIEQDIFFSVKNLSTTNLQDISFDVRKGEIVGLFGLMGCGRTELAKALFGAVKRQTGVLTLDGKSINPKSPYQAKKSRIAYIPSDRKAEGLMLIHPVSSNITISILDKLKVFGMINYKKERELSSDWVDKLSIKTPTVSTVVDSLSGGNQQKVVLAKWLETNPQLLILNEPTRGIDVGSKTEIYNLMDKLTQNGISIIMISSDMPEVMGMSDRMVIMFEGQVRDVLAKSEYSQDIILEKAIGLS